MYIEDWESFAQQAEALFRSQPLRTRYVLKYQHSQGKLTLKVTDDITVKARSRGLGFLGPARHGF